MHTHQNAGAGEPSREIRATTDAPADSLDPLVDTFVDSARVSATVSFDYEWEILEDRFRQLALLRELFFVTRDNWKTDAEDLGGLEDLGRLVGQYRASRTSQVLYEGTEAIVRINLERHNRVAGAAVAATDAEVARALLETVRARLTPTPADDRVSITFWNLGQHRLPRSSHRRMDCPAWAEVAGNYAAGTRGSVDALMNGYRPDGGGRLLLWHGEPGTGKTYALRALAKAWRSWCDVAYVVDPEAFFGEVDYMMSVLLDDDDDEDRDDEAASEGRWRLLVLEDTGELLSADAKRREGQRLSRFLNVVDGLIGQGLRVMVLVTTNDPVETLHPAVARPGRCASVVRFDALSCSEATRWLAARGSDVPAPGSMTLADCYALLNGRAVAPRKRRVGFASVGGGVDFD